MAPDWSNVYLVGGAGVVLLLGVMGFLLIKSHSRRQRLQLTNLTLERRLEESNAALATNNQKYESKLQFFIDICHELRTPLTLILAPFEELPANINAGQSQSLVLVQKNAFRLSRLINQLGDLLKLELSEFQLKASQIELIQTIRQMMEAFNDVAAKRKIDYKLITQESELILWLDLRILEKIILNLLINAFKSTPDNGQIYVKILRHTAQGEVDILIEDSGIGMNSEAVKRAFDLFQESTYTWGNEFGLGLSLVKELINLHKGEISLTSVQWKGTTVRIQLPLSDAYLQNEQRTSTRHKLEKLIDTENSYITDFYTISPVCNESTEPIAKKNNSILLIEGDHDLRNYLIENFRNIYDVILADTGIVGLQIAFGTIPDLIICDANLSDKNGSEITNILKADFKTSHIPVIILTPNSDAEKQIGSKGMADAYIVKPFNIQLLKESIKNLLKGRITLREHFATDTIANSKEAIINKLDKKFVSDFSAIVENNIANENFGVDDICRNIGVSKVQLYRKVKALLEVSVNDYVINKRLQKAKYLLKNEQISIAEVALKVGFSSPAYFSTVFKSKYHVTPKQYKLEIEV